MERVVVVGAGLAGLTFAAAMRRRGLEVEVRDERPALGGGAGLTIWPNALAALDAIGLGDVVRDLGEPAASATIRRADGSLVRRLDPVAMMRSLGEPARVVDRGELQAVLAEHAGPIVLDAGVADPASLDADLVVGADGFRSAVARHLDPRIRERPAGYVAWRGVAPIAVDPSMAGVVWGDAAEAGVAPMTGGRTYWFATRAGAAEVWRPDAGLWPDPLPELIAATPPSCVLQHEMLDRDPPRRWFDDRHVVIGDAAHAMQPGLGQGGCLAIEDAVVLAALWAEHGGGASTFAAFERVRRPRAMAALRASRTAGRVLHGPRGRLAATVARRTPEPVAMRLAARFASRDAGLRALAPTTGR
ncbi:FAD-dependent monooxygenase [Aeromicrobium alkaliterrae]|uniref:FAD-dependent oxidoreductase n=1 Tax=Aeromicrobium alkaliterrae TaxID=302168 RepID=A0ABN2JY00_9ACTN